ncbi:hypothetical protein CkaCkLH20_11708 [Colletotrichum karsti]|uniref:Uncharacterized protein n=1 Tax=Colletotrichum karsti TaxID=1095194 RepID=A0A9P6LD48_9PEZI|nr:uncharacterized protein CkaCkLH20_11708 [Colletotrichum karsti]KAF9870809.1 hypothetical protein CkaCkLH20_11708 [Colletotrichum karsti]
MSSKREHSLSPEAEKKRARVASPTCGRPEGSAVPAAGDGIGKTPQRETQAVVERLSDDRYSFRGDWEKVVDAISAIEELRCSDYICIGTVRITHKLDYLTELLTSPNPKTHKLLKFNEYLTEDYDNASVICGNCGFIGHTLIDCIWPDKDGSIYGCPMCNTKLHCMDECRLHKSLTDRQLCYILVFRRANKPAIRTTRAWVDHVRTAAHRDYRDLLEAGFPWSWKFGRRVQRPENVHRRPWDAYDYARNSELQHTLPRDPATRDLETVLRSPALANERHKSAASTERHRAGDSYVGRGIRKNAKDRSVERVPADEKEITWESIFSE